MLILSHKFVYIHANTKLDWQASDMRDKPRFPWCVLRPAISTEVKKICEIRFAENVR